MRILTVVNIIGLVIGILSYLSSCQSNVNIQTAQFAVNGQKLYVAHCQNCHGAKGEGLGKLYPPLTDHDFLEKNRAKLSCIVRNGLSEEIEVSGQKFKETMPANPQLAELEIAYILTYITTNFGKSDSTYSAAEVKAALQNCNR
ncbi:c-type cytochrome [Sphingobacterium sp. Mn56C]|uniref:c-type cytochrome n=1 Tax=Sphingobacterium sp. Mn56C TaxID=3395261 RepID=UPI003BD893A9